MTDLKITKGEWQVFSTESGLFWVDSENGESICDFYHKVSDYHFHVKDNAKANAEFVAEAGNVYNETGLTPRELLELARELRNSLYWFVDNDDTNRGDKPIPKLNGQSWNEYNSFWIKGLEDGEAALEKSESIK